MIGISTKEFILNLRLQIYITKKVLFYQLIIYFTVIFSYAIFLWKQHLVQIYIL